MRLGAKCVLLLALIMLVPTPAEAQLRGEKTMKLPRWEAAIHVDLGGEGDPLLIAGWGLSAAGRVTDWLAIAADAGKKQVGYKYCKGALCVPAPVPPGFCPCTDTGDLFTGNFVVAGPRILVTERFFANVLAGGISSAISPTRFIVRPGVGWDFGNEHAAFRLEVNLDIVPRQTRLTHFWGVAGIVIRIGRH